MPVCQRHAVSTYPYLLEQFSALLVDLPKYGKYLIWKHDWEMTEKND